MFEDFIKNNAMEDEIRPSEKRIKANRSALRSLIEQEESMNNNRKPRKIFKKPFAVAATIAACVCLTSVTVFAGSNGAFKSIKKAFYNDDNALRASDPSEYAFMPEIDPIVGDGVTLNVTEAAADSHALRIFMDMTFENGIPEEVLNDNALNYNSINFEKWDSSEYASFSIKGISFEENVISFYAKIGGIQEEEWEKNGFELGIENFGYYKSAQEFVKLADISGKITIPSEKINKNSSITASSEIDGVPVKMELSLLGINMTFDSEADYKKIEDKISHRGIITPLELSIFMKDGTIYGGGENMEKAMEMLDGGSARIQPDGTYYRYINFALPVDIENIEKISLEGYDFIFE